MKFWNLLETIVCLLPWLISPKFIMEKSVFACFLITIHAKLIQTIKIPIEGSEQSFVSTNGVDYFGAVILKFVWNKNFDFHLKSLKNFGIQSHWKFEITWRQLFDFCLLILSLTEEVTDAKNLTEEVEAVLDGGKITRNHTVDALFRNRTTTILLMMDHHALLVFRIEPQTVVASSHK